VKHVDTHTYRKTGSRICGSLSNPADAGHGYALPAYGAVSAASCSNFRKRFVSIVTLCAVIYISERQGGNGETPRESFPSPWIDAVTSLSIAQRPPLRWHDSGDLQSVEHLRNIIRACQNCRGSNLASNPEYQTSRHIAE